MNTVDQSSPWDLIGKIAGQGVAQNMPRGIEQGMNRGMLQGSLDDISRLSKDPNANPVDLSLALMKAGAGIPGSERYLATILPQLMNRNIANKAYGGGQQGQGQGQGQQSPGMQQAQGQGQNQPQRNQANTINPINEFQGQNANQTQDQYKAQYDVETPEEIDQFARRMADETGRPEMYKQILSEKTAKNNLSKAFRSNLESQAQSKLHIPNENLSDFMRLGRKYPQNNIDEWLTNTNRDYSPFIENKNKLKNAFIPGIGSALMGENREEALSKLTPTVQDEVARGREPETRAFLESEYLSPTEVEAQIHPLNDRNKSAIDKFPKGIFPANKKATWGEVADVYRGKMKTNPFVDYETAVAKDPKAMEVMQNRLADFFSKNVDDDSSLLVLANKLWDDKDYDWRQFGPALRAAEAKGLKLNPRQKTELVDVESNPPMQSLPHIFRDWGRFSAMHRGSK